jgi:hypothetical protein
VAGARASMSLELDALASSSQIATTCYQPPFTILPQRASRLTHNNMATAFRALRLAQRAPASRQMPISRITSALPRTYATATIREARPDKPADQVEQASEDLSGDDAAMNGNYPDPSKTSALPLKRQFRDPHAEWWDPQERRNYGEPVHEVRRNGWLSCWSTMADRGCRITTFWVSSHLRPTPT